MYLIYGKVPNAELDVATVGQTASEDTCTCNTPIANLAVSTHFHYRPVLRVMPTPCIPSNNSVHFAGHFIMATRDRHGAAWMSTCHSDCCSRQGQQDILSTVYRDEKQLTNVSTYCTGISILVFFVQRAVAVWFSITGKTRHFYSANQKTMNYAQWRSCEMLKCCKQKPSGCETDAPQALVVFSS